MSERTADGDARAPLKRLARNIMAEHRKALAGCKAALEHARRAGELLIQAKAQLSHGEWLPWLADNCDLQRRMVNVYMQIAREWPRVEEFSNEHPDTHLDI